MLVHNFKMMVVRGVKEEKSRALGCVVCGLMMVDGAGLGPEQRRLDGQGRETDMGCASNCAQSLCVEKLDVCVVRGRKCMIPMVG